MEDCIFCKIIKGEIPSSKIYEDDEVYAFLDIQPVNPGHVLVVPKTHSVDLLDMGEEDTKNVFAATKKIAKAVVEGTGAEGFNIGMNNKKAAGQLVLHSHIHIIPRFNNDGLSLWPGKKYKEGQIDEIQKQIITKLR